MKLALFSVGLIAVGCPTSALRGTTSEDAVECPPAHTADYDGFPYTAGEGAVYQGSLWICNENTDTPPSETNPAWSKLGRCEDRDEVTPTPAGGDDSVECPPAHTADYDGFPYRAGEGAVYEGILWVCNEDTNTPPSDDNSAWSKLRECPSPEPAPTAAPTPSDREQTVVCPPVAMAGYEEGSVYSVGDSVVYQGYSWQAVQETTTAPSDTNSAWRKIGKCKDQGVPTTFPATTPVPTAAPPAPPTPSDDHQTVVCPPVAMAGYEEGSVYSVGDSVVYQGYSWQAVQETTTAPSDTDSAWSKIGKCKEQSVVCPPVAMAGYEEGSIYSVGDSVVYQGYSWQAVQETTTAPSDTNSAWRKIGKCKDQEVPTTFPATTPIPTTTAPTTPAAPRPTAAPPVPSGGTVTCPAEAAWSGRVYMKDEMAVYSNILWKANWYAQNPPSELDLAWTKMGKCDTAEVVPPCTADLWVAGKVYRTPTDVTYNSGRYRNKWYDGGIVPPSPQDANWVYLGPCSGGMA